MSKISRSDLGMIAESGPDNHAVLISRDVWESPVFRNGLEAGVFVWMMTTAAPEADVVATPWGEVHLDAGQIITSERHMAIRFDMKPSEVRSLTERMKDAGLISKVLDKVDRDTGAVGTIWAVDMSKFAREAPQS